MIKTLGTRYPELGRIRLGEKGDKGQPVKGTNLRFSSPDRVPLDALAATLGGTVEPWPNGEQPWQLTTESPSVDVYLPPDPIDTAYELWGKGGCTRRCDGERATFLDRGPEGEFMNTGDCLCLAEDRTPGDRKDPEACNVTVRLRLIIPDVPGVGVWICTSHSIYAAMELPGQIAVLESAMGGSTGLIPATFAIEARQEKKPYEKYPRKYIVPVLRVRASLVELVAGKANGQGIGGGGRALDSSRPALAPAGPPPGVDHETGEVAPSPAAPKPPAQRSAARPKAPAAGGKVEPGWQRTVRRKADELWPDIDPAARAKRLLSIIEETVDKRSVEDLGPTDANAVLAALKGADGTDKLGGPHAAFPEYDAPYGGEQLAAQLAGGEPF